MTVVAEQAHKGDPAFAPLYRNKRSRNLPETPDRLDRRDYAEDVLADMGWAQWTDVALDFRVPTARDPLPRDFDDVDALALTWTSDAPGWALEGWCWKTRRTDLAGETQDETGPASLPDTVSVLRFTDPDGFRFAFVVNQDQPGKPGRFASGRLAFLLPPMRHLLSNFADPTPTRRRGGWAAHRFRTHLDVAPTETLALEGSASPTARYSPTVLRDAVRDPDRWFGPDVDWRTGTISTAFRPMDPTRVLLAWASAGVASYAEAEPWTAAGLDACEMAAWQTLNDRFVDVVHEDGTVEVADPDEGDGPWTDAELRAWFVAFGGGRMRREKAVRFRAAGLGPEQAARWAPVLGVYGVSNAKMVVDRFEAAGWDATDVEKAFSVLYEAERRAGAYVSRWNMGASVTLDAISEWVFVPAARMRGYVRAQISASEARAFEESGQPPTDEALEMMAALLPDPEPDPFF